jgi:hypothetical protein
MAEREAIPGRDRAGSGGVGGDRGKARDGRALDVDGDDRDRSRGQEAQIGPRGRDGHDQEAVHPLAQREATEHLVTMLGSFDGMHDEFEGGAGGDICGLPEARRGLGAVQPIDDDGDRPCPAGAQAPGGLARQKSSAAMASRMRRRVPSSTCGFSLSTRETVVRLTPASRATSPIVGSAGPTITARTARAFRRRR